MLVMHGTPVVMIVVLLGERHNTMVSHPSRAPAAINDPAGYPRIRYRYGDPLFSRVDGAAGLSTVHPSVFGGFRDLFGLRLKTVELPDTVVLRLI
jgi:hypothetical protein